MKRYIPPILWMAVIFLLSSIPGKEFPVIPFPGFDKLVHIVLYSILGFLWSKALGGRIYQAILIGIVYGLSDEVHQLFVPFREFSLTDLLSDAVGVTGGVLCQLSLKRLRSGR